MRHIRVTGMFQGLHLDGKQWNWWRWRELNPRPKDFSEQSLHAYPIRSVSRRRVRTGRDVAPLALNCFGENPRA
jgi:hypothetical protein